MKKLLSLFLLAACGCTEPVPEIEYAATAVITLSPDELTIQSGDWVHITVPGHPATVTDSSYTVHNVYSHELLGVNDEVFIIRCDREAGGFRDCDEYERDGYVIVGRETYDAARVAARGGGCSPSGSVNTAGGLTLGASSCFGLIRLKTFFDSTKVEFILAPWSPHYVKGDPMSGHGIHVFGCGETWIGYRLLARTGDGIGEYPLDAMFSDTTWIDARC